MRSLLLSVAAAVIGVWGCAKAEKKRPEGDGSKRGNRIVLVDRAATAKVVVVKEKEPNNEPSTATTLAVGAVVRGNLDGETDKDFYKFSVTSVGFLSAQLTGIDRVDLVLELRDGAGKRLAISDRGPAKTVEGLPNYPVSEGDYFFVVSEFVKKRAKTRRRRRRRKKLKKTKPPRTGPSANYELSVKLTTTKAAVSATGEGTVEVEPNDKVASAIELKRDTQGTGYIGWNKDRDLWKLLLDDVAGKVVLDVDVAGVSDVRLVLEILDVDGKRLLRRWGAKGKAVVVRGLRPAPGHEAHFARLFARRSQPGESYTVRFSVRKPGASDETEPNDKMKTASPLVDGNKATIPPQTGGLRRGYLTRGDVDYFRLPKRPQPMAFSVSISPPAEVDIVLFVMDAKGGLLAKSDEGKSGAREAANKVRIPANTDVVVKVSGKGNSAQPERYDLRWSIEAAAASPAPVAPAPSKPAKKSGSDDLEEYGN